MKTSFQDGALTDAQQDRLAEFLMSAKGGQAMNLEELDGFFVALITGPEIVPPSEYLPEVFGGDLSDTCEFSSLTEANEMLGLLVRHWNSIAGTLEKGDVHLPILLEYDGGVCLANDWAHGFMRGVGMRRAGWAELIGDEKEGQWMAPVLMLYHEHDEDPAMRPDPIGPELRQEVIAMMIAGTVQAYRFFRKHRLRPPTAYQPEAPRSNDKVGRNDPCPCGSGKKYKRCCGGVTVN